MYADRYFAPRFYPNRYFGTAAAGEPSTLEITTTSLQNGYDGVAYSQTINVTGGTAPYTFAISAGALPDGLSLNTDTGAITGTPTVQATFNFTVTVTDAALDTDDQAYAVTVFDQSALGSGQRPRKLMYRLRYRA